nr:hypothetical protein [Tanacetum cinerariifolium]
MCFFDFPACFQTFKTLCLLNYALMIRHDYDIMFSLRRGALQALVDKKKVIIIETSVRSGLQLEDNEVFLDKQVEGMFKHKEIYVTPSHTKKVFANIKRQGKAFFSRVTPLFPSTLVQAQQEKHRKTRRKDIELPQTSVPTEVVADKVVYGEMYDSVERAVTTATRLDAEQDRGSRPRRQETTRDAGAQTRSERVSKLSNDPPLSRVNTFESRKDRLKLNELIELCT